MLISCVHQHFNVLSIWCGTWTEVYIRSGNLCDCDDVRAGIWVWKMCKCCSRMRRTSSFRLSSSPQLLIRSLVSYMCEGFTSLVLNVEENAMDIWVHTDTHLESHIHSWQVVNYRTLRTRTHSHTLLVKQREEKNLRKLRHSCNYGKRGRENERITASKKNAS